MAAGVHHTGILGSKIRARFFRDGQGVHITAQGQSRPATAKIQQARHALTPHLRIDREAHPPQFVRDKPRRPHFFQRQLGMGMQLFIDALQITLISHT